ncbi:MAG: HAMP domain-containing histidine kinase [Nannocystaceae bacterium]|nr:HAMP domain-containing histidine kinase [Nannocystaceae bacterium]
MNLFRKITEPVLAYEHAAVRDALGGSIGWNAELPSQPGFEEFERRGMEGAFDTAVRGRLFLLTVTVGFTLWLAAADPAWWRRILLLAAVVHMAVLDMATRRRFRAYGVQLSSVRRNISAMTALQAVMIFATGGLVSPMLPLMLPVAFFAGLLADRWGVQRLVWFFQVPVLSLFTFLHWTDAIPSLVPLPFRADGEMSMLRLLVAASVMASLVSMFGLLGSRLRREARQNLEQLQSAQRAALGVHRQRADDLTMMSGEIAHELKNPLASVKGLTQLLLRGCRPADVKAAERLGVLEREVSRMQEILEEFLNFSRPLTPLTRSVVEVGPMCADVISLHEAMAASLSVTTHLEVGEGLVVEGDGRKIGQVLINLLQNALEAAPVDSEVRLLCAATGAGVMFEVRDAGPGLSIGPDYDAFGPGVTTKEDGNGLGLTIARAIVEQHGGTLSLATHPEGGCVARFVLPGAPLEGE